MVAIGANEEGKVIMSVALLVGNGREFTSRFYQCKFFLFLPCLINGIFVACFLGKVADCGPAEFIRVRVL